jgi:uncharacterized protein (TIGR02594 family)
MRGIEVAEMYLGLKETAPKDRLKLRELFKVAKIDLDPKTTPWCAAFVNGCEVKAGNKGTGRVNARSFIMYGTKVSLEQAREGDICVFSRGNSSWQGHVTYFVSHNGMEITVLGGNQRDCVCKSIYTTENLITIRRP